MYIDTLKEREQSDFKKQNPINFVRILLLLNFAIPPCSIDSIDIHSVDKKSMYQYQ